MFDQLLTSDSNDEKEFRTGMELHRDNCARARLSVVFQDDKTAFQEILFRCWFNLFDFLLRTD